MISEAKTTVRNVAWMVMQQGANLLSAALFAAILPRAMGPDAYGRYNLILSLCSTFAVLSALGLTETMARYIPGFAAAGDQDGLQRLFQHMLGLRVVASLLFAVSYLVITTLWLRELDSLLLLLAAGVVLLRASMQAFFGLLLGLNRAARWASRDVMHGWLSLLLVLPGFYLAGLRGALLAVVLTELIVGLVALVWVMPHVPRLRARLNLRYLAPYLAFGLQFYVGHLITNVYASSGQTLLRLVSGDYGQIAQYGAAYRIFTTATMAIYQFTMAFAPWWAALLTQRRTDLLRQWAERLLKWLSVLGTLGAFGALLTARELVPLVLGKAYAPAAANVVPLSLALLALAPSRVASLLALTYERPRVEVVAHTVRLLTFWVVGLLLTPRMDSLGACLAVLIAMSMQSVYATWRMRRVVRYSLRMWAKPVGLGALFLPLLWLRGMLWTNLALYAAFLFGYIALLFLLRIVSPDEVRAIWQAVRSRATLPTPGEI
ncbi:MAG: lipopolysaccharide biosynthesis protein [Chloroflexi bacterium]|nr:lipopolysaccharide biosynthesis protein [Chloroflexota bacterium]